jgi:hypothetical protein
MSFPRHEGEEKLNVAALECSTGYSFLGCVRTRSITINAAYIDGRHPVHGLGQDNIYMMTSIPLPNPKDPKPLIRTTIHVITPSEEVVNEYSAHDFCLASGEPGS